MANPLTSAQFVRLLDKRLRTVSENAFKELTSMIPEFYTMLPSDSAFEEFYEIGSLGDIPEFNGKISYLSLSPEYYKKVEPKEYAGGLMFERKLLDDKKYGVLDGRAKLLTESAHRVREKQGVKAFANAFSAAFDYMTSEEGLSLCNTAHTTKSGVSTSTGFSNSGTSALNATNVSATYLAMRRFKNNIGERIEIEPDTLIVPDSLGDKAEEIVGTEKGLYSAEGTKNMSKGRYKVIRYKRLDDYSTTDWYMVDSKQMKKFLVWIDRIKPEINNTVDFDTLMIKHSVYFRIAYAWLNWRWVYGNNVS
jgi:phage major head subunit gpT-like protein